MSFQYSYTFPISGPNKIPRFKQWVGENLPGVRVSLPPQVPAKAEALTIRLKSADDRQTLMTKMAGVKI